MNLILLALHRKSIHSKNIIGFRLLDSDTKEVKDIPYENVVNVLRNGDITVDGIDISEGTPKGSNGSFDRYTQIIDNIAIGKCPLVIVKEYANKVYDVANHLGKIAHMQQKDIISFAKEEGLANGKIVTGENGEYISSINGEYLKDKSCKDFASGEILKKKLNILGCKDYTLNNDNIAYGNKAMTNSKLVIGTGCLGVADCGFENHNEIKDAILPNTCIKLGSKAFKNCINMQSIKLSNNLVSIGDNCFEDCIALETLYIPNSVRFMGRNSLRNCKALKEISVGPIRLDLVSTGINRKTKITIRR